MKRIAILAGALGAAALAQLSSLGHDVVTIDRDRPVSTKRRRIGGAMQFTGNRSRYMPHQGAKERERAKRSWMQSFHGPMSDYSPNLRSAPVMHQMSKRHSMPKYEA